MARAVADVHAVDRRLTSVQDNRAVTLSQALFSPGRIALIGASTDASRLTARAQVYLRRHGFTGDLFPVNPRADTVLGEKA